MTAIPLGRRLPGVSSNLPGRPIRTLIRRFLSAPPLFGFAPGGVCRAASVAGRAVRSYRTVSPLPAEAQAAAGGLLSVALSLGSPPPDIIRHRMSMEPGLSSPAAFRRVRGAAVQPTDKQGMGRGGRGVKGRAGSVDAPGAIDPFLRRHGRASRLTRDAISQRLSSSMNRSVVRPASAMIRRSVPARTCL